MLSNQEQYAGQSILWCKKKKKAMPCHLNIFFGKVKI